jgi:hypothetical protein
MSVGLHLLPPPDPHWVEAPLCLWAGGFWWPPCQEVRFPIRRFVLIAAACAMRLSSHSKVRPQARNLLFVCICGRASSQSPGRQRRLNAVAQSLLLWRFGRDPTGDHAANISVVSGTRHFEPRWYGKRPFQVPAPPLTGSRLARGRARPRLVEQVNRVLFFYSSLFARLHEAHGKEVRHIR